MPIDEFPEIKPSSSVKERLAVSDLADFDALYNYLESQRPEIGNELVDACIRTIERVQIDHNLLEEPLLLELSSQKDRKVPFPSSLRDIMRTFFVKSGKIPAPSSEITTPSTDTTFERILGMKAISTWSQLSAYLDRRMISPTSEFEGFAILPMRKEIALARAGKPYDKSLIAPSVLKVVEVLMPNNDFDPYGEKILDAEGR